MSKIISSRQQIQGSINNYLKLNVKTLIILILILIGIYMLAPHLIGVQEAVKLFKHENKYYLLLAFLSEIVSYVGAATLLGIILSRLGYKIRFFDRFRLSSISAFAIHFFPIGSFGEPAVNFYFLKKYHVTAGSILIMLVLRGIMTYAAFFSLLFIGLVLVPTAPHLPYSPKLVASIVALLLLYGVIYMIFLYRHKPRFLQRWRFYMNFVNSILRIIHIKTLAPNTIDEIFEDIYKGIGLFGQKKRVSIWAFLSGLLYWLGDIACLFFVFLSFGHLLHGGLLLFGYGVSTLAGIISFIPGGLGVTDGALGLVFRGLGAPFNIVLMSVLVYRFLSFWIWIPIGFISYLSMKHENS